MKGHYKKMPGYQPGSDKNFPEPRPTIQHDKPLGPERKSGFVERFARGIERSIGSGTEAEPSRRARQKPPTYRGSRKRSRYGSRQPEYGGGMSFSMFIPKYQPRDPNRDAEAIFGSPDWASPGYIPPGMRRFF